jgi:glutathione S-transferase
MASPVELRLITIAVSHYCEKARWALQRAQIDFREIRHIQLFHYGPTLWYGRTPYAPVLLTDQGPLVDSTHILRFADRALPPERRLWPVGRDAEIQRWLDRFDGTLGVETRRWLYLLGFERLGRQRALDLLAQGSPRWQRGATRWFLPLAKLYFRVRLGVNQKNVVRGLDAIQRVFDEVDAALADGRRYLLGDHFSAADLTFASLSALLLQPPEYGVKLLDLDDLEPDDRKLVERFRATKAGAFALRVYAEERHGCGAAN